MIPAFVAEVSSNHHRDLDRCLAFIDRSAHIGCSAVKFQLFRITEVFTPEVLAQSTEHSRRAAWELPEEFLAPLARRCREKGVEFGCTAVSVRGVAVLRPYVDFLKLTSYDLLRLDLIAACAATGLPLILSTGMATMPEIAAAVDAARNAGCGNLTLLHCVSAYPCPPADCNLSVLETLRQAFGCPVGWSDHSAAPGVVHRAVHRWGASLVEFHLDLDGTGDEYASGHCWLPEQIGRVIAQVRQGIAADGSGRKEPAQAELEDRGWRSDPSDGLRPLAPVRELWRKRAGEGS